MHLQNTVNARSGFADMHNLRGASSVRNGCGAAAHPVVLITGGSAGIGRAIAHEFAEHGHDLFLIGRRAVPLQNAARDLADRFAVQVHTLALDITSAGAIDCISEKLASSDLFVSHLINNAGTWLNGPILKADTQSLGHVLSANVLAVHAITRAVLPDMIQRRRGAILNVGSLAGMVPTPGFAFYGASKSFLHSMTMALREELRGTCISVALLAPGLVQTAFVMPVPRLSPLALVASSPQTVARAAYRGLMSNQSIVVPGFFWLIVWLGIRLIPRRVSARILSALMLVSAARHTSNAATLPDLDPKGIGPANVLIK